MDWRERVKAELGRQAERDADEGRKAEERSEEERRRREEQARAEQAAVFGALDELDARTLLQRVGETFWDAHATLVARNQISVNFDAVLRTRFGADFGRPFYGYGLTRTRKIAGRLVRETGRSAFGGPYSVDMPVPGKELTDELLVLGITLPSRDSPRIVCYSTIEAWRVDEWDGLAEQLVPSILSSRSPSMADFVEIPNSDQSRFERALVEECAERVRQGLFKI